MEILKQFETLLDKYLVEKAPVLPEDIKGFLVAVLPWLTLIGVIITLPMILLFFGIGSVVLPFAAASSAYAGETGLGYIFGLIIILITIASLVLMGCSLPGLFNKAKSGWTFLFYAATLGLLTNILQLAVFSVLFSVLWFYMLFQIKASYK